jgi:putative photosynthetic complex assembly protein
MRSQTQGERIPKPLLYGVGGLVIVTLLGVTALRVAGVEPIAQPPLAEAVQTETVIIVEVPGGGVALHDPADNVALASLPVNEDGFVRGIRRVLDRVRMQHGVEGNGPVTLIRWNDGRYSLRDPATGWQIELKGFGQSNLETFVQLMSDVRDRREASK